jgi:hypothetical protein
MSSEWSSIVSTLAEDDSSNGAPKISHKQSEGSRRHAYMQLLATREYPVIDYQTMAEFIGHERLFRAANGDGLLAAYVIRLEAGGGGAHHLVHRARRHIMYGSFWEFAKNVAE